jgi:hypothetical protein
VGASRCQPLFLFATGFAGPGLLEFSRSGHDRPPRWWIPVEPRRRRLGLHNDTWPAPTSNSPRRTEQSQGVGGLLEGTGLSLSPGCHPSCPDLTYTLYGIEGRVSSGNDDNFTDRTAKNGELLIMSRRGCIGDADQGRRPAVNPNERASSVENPTFDALCGLVRRPAVTLCCYSIYVKTWGYAECSGAQP